MYSYKLVIISNDSAHNRDATISDKGALRKSTLFMDSHVPPDAFLSLLSVVLLLTILAARHFSLLSQSAFCDSLRTVRVFHSNRLFEHSIRTFYSSFLTGWSGAGMPAAHKSYSFTFEPLSVTPVCISVTARLTLFFLALPLPKPRLQPLLRV